MQHIARTGSVDQQLCIATPQLWIDLAGDVSDLADHEAEKAHLGCGEVGAEFARRDRPRDCRLCRGHESLRESLGEAGASRGCHENGVEAAIGGPRLHDAEQQRPDSGAGILDLPRGLGEPNKGVDLLVEQRVEHGVFVGELAVYRADPDSRGLRHIVQSHARTASGEHRGRRLENAVPVAFRIGSRRSDGGGGHMATLA